MRVHRYQSSAISDAFRACRVLDQSRRERIERGEFPTEPNEANAVGKPTQQPDVPEACDDPPAPERETQGKTITSDQLKRATVQVTARMENGQPVYRPTVHYAYHPCNDAVLSVRELQTSNWQIQRQARILGEEIIEGIDELGALLMGDHGALWYIDLATGKKAVLVAEQKLAALKPPTQATQEEKERQERYSVEGYHWSPDSKQIAFVSYRLVR